MSDRMISGTLKQYPLRFHITDMTQTIEMMNQIHDTTPVAAAAAGRTMIGTALMTTTLKNDDDILSVIINGDGEIGRIIVTADKRCNLKSEIKNPHTGVYFNDAGKLDVKRIVGKGTITVLKDIGLKHPYRGEVELVSGEIAEDFAYYYAKSEQLPSVVSLGVFVSKELEVLAAGGYMIQVMPDCPMEIIDDFTLRMQTIPSMTSMMLDGMDPEQIAQILFQGYEYQIQDTNDPQYYCDCSIEKIKKVLITLGREELQAIRDEDHPIEMKCHFCNTAYSVSIEEIAELIQKL